MTHRYSPLIVAAALLLGFVGADSARADLASDIKAVLADKTLHKAEVGVQILKLGAAPDGDASIFKSNAETPLIPASNLKLVTTSAALDTLGADFKFRTLLLKHNDDLVLIGDGDPTLGDAELLRKSGWNSTTLFKNWPSS